MNIVQRRHGDESQLRELIGEWNSGMRSLCDVERHYVTLSNYVRQSSRLRKDKIRSRLPDPVN